MQRIRGITQYLLVLWPQYLAFCLLRCRVIGYASLLGNIATVYGPPCSRSKAVPTRSSRIFALCWFFPSAFPSHARYAGQPKLVFVILQHDIAFVVFAIVPVFMRFGKE
jgi:hypothetical protein